MSSLARTLHLFVFLLAATVLCGCQKARNYDPRSAAKKSPGADKSEKKPEKSPEPIPDDFAWQDDTVGNPSNRDFPIEFVSENSQPDEWKKLKLYWNDPGLAGTAAIGLPGLPGMAALAAAQTRAAVKIKVPVGLDDPLAYIPAANPPTRGKWELGRRLFFDPKWLTSKGDQSCATCHIPTEGFANHKPRIMDTFNTPTLLNCVYNTHQFWDGRVTYLEEVVQQTLQDEREPKETGPFKHVWHGVIGRLRDNKSYREQFNRVFGVSPTQDAVGKALATYMRTLLSADSIHDRAVQMQHGKGAGSLAVSHYEAVLDDAALKALGRPKEGKAVAKELFHGYRLFIGKASCASCHSAGNGTWSDGRFHNIGVAADEIDPARMLSVQHTDSGLGRFAWAPYGERNRYLRGAFKTPTLRSLLRTAPWFHNGQEKELAAVVRFHVEPNPVAAPFNLSLDPKLADAKGAHRNFGLKKADVDALVLFLEALNGEMDPFLLINPN